MADSRDCICNRCVEADPFAAHSFGFATACRPSKHRGLRQRLLGKDH
ncbi:hypothetical protein PhCBS80983_g02679 [Powellomyces hirtus]|uniref:Uncharacterized protein n=1 Tax=Powellomyces hirtus TaxID=109895 RepID=A0A507E7P4_9FUNG|nr:hypothetical protein PhCBS80983_g02679 [Powellomyces hirtus]